MCIVGAIAGGDAPTASAHTSMFLMMCFSSLIILRIRPIDKRLQYQVERLIKAAQIAAKQDAQLKGGKKGVSMAEDGVEPTVDEEDEGDATRFGPRRDSLVAKAGGKAAAGAAKGGDDDRAGVYRPPKINPVSMEG